MSSDSGKKCSIDELKRLNQPQELTPLTPSCPTQEQWTHLMHTLNAQYRVLEEMRSMMETMTIQSEKLTKETMEICQRLEQVGRKNGRWHLRLSQVTLPRPSLAWLWAIPILVGLLTIWYASDAIWNNLLIPLSRLFQ